MNDSLLTRFNSLTHREKLIALATILMLIWSAWDSFIYQPLSAKKQQISAELQTVNTQLSAYIGTVSEIERVGKIDVNQANRTQLIQLKNQLKVLKAQLNAGDKEFVSAHKMTNLLTDMLNQNSGLALKKLETLPVTTLTDPLTNLTEQSWVYRHGLSLTLSGSFVDTLAYLKSLEALPWRFSWGSIDYQVIKYPVAETTLRVYTLSFEENWLGL